MPEFDPYDYRRTEDLFYGAKKQKDKEEAKGGFLEGAGGLVKGVLENSQKRQEREALMNSLFNRRGQAFGGTGMQGRTTTLGDGTLTQVDPNTFSPIVLPGGSGYAGRSSGQRVAGGLSGALSGFQAGASTGIPHLAGIGAIVGGIGGLFG